MSGQSLGLIEAVGLTVAMEAADAAMKSANVQLIGYELTKGGGLVTLKFAGEVGAMNAAVAAGVAAASKIGSVYAWKVIARTASGLDKLIASKETCGVAGPENVAPTPEAAPAAVAQCTPQIPLVNLDPAPALSSCADIIAGIPADTPAEKAAQAAEKDETSQTETAQAAVKDEASQTEAAQAALKDEASRDEAAPAAGVKPARLATPDGRKPLRAKAKSARK
ncbi:Propanediol utilization protein PduA [Mixta theicola]|nr:BMC domain-containing protein [Mixta theicola]QHM76554.1 Propanediol utilization protein PduA [Mixta theicola]